MEGAVEAREALVAMSLRYLSGLAADARTDRSLLREVIGQYVRVAEIQGVPTVPSLGKLDDAEQSLATADELVESLLSDDPNDVQGLELSAQIRLDRTILADSQRRVADANGYLDGAIVRVEALIVHHDVTRAQRYQAAKINANLALAANNLHRYDDGIRLAHRFLELAPDANIEPAMVANVQSTLANSLRMRGDLDDALIAIRAARAIVGPLGSDPRSVLNRYGLLLREGLILGEDGGVSLERPDDAVAPLREAFTLMNARALADSKDATSGNRTATSGRELGDILRWQRPADALAVYDVGLQRLGERTEDVSVKRATAELLAGSAYALRRLGRPAEASERVSQALALLTAAQDYPTDRIALDSTLYTVLLARADHDAERGLDIDAVRRYRELLDGVMRGTPAVEDDLTFADRLSRLYEVVTTVERRAGDVDAAAELEGRRRALWQHWAQRLPGNPFVARRLESSLAPDH